jgi:hypothetical protein
MRRWIASLGLLASACAAVLGVHEIDYRGDADAGPGAESAGPVYSPVVCRIDERGDPCNAISEQCCLEFVHRLAYCTAGHSGTCDGGPDGLARVIACDDSADCFAVDAGVPICCLIYDPYSGAYGSKCVADPESCTLADKRYVLCDDTQRDQCDGGLHCTQLATSPYSACQQ